MTVFSLALGVLVILVFVFLVLLLVFVPLVSFAERLRVPFLFQPTVTSFFVGRLAA